VVEYEEGKELAASSSDLMLRSLIEHPPQEPSQRAMMPTLRGP
jgi:hypothetical protein